MVRLTDGRSVEVGLIGSEGFVGLPVLLETDPGPHHVVCQVTGPALRMPSNTFRATLRRSGVLRRLLYRYSGLRLIEQTQLIACNALHPVSPRLARWLLMASDRLPADEFRLTQEFLAQMLAVRRPYLNSAAQALQRNGYISYHRGRIKLLNRSALEATACEDYSVLRAEYARLLVPIAS
jgi:CRP-like cAMP-binding protein